jgi:RNA polymerase sigma-70 factor (ECF subfamily)
VETQDVVQVCLVNVLGRVDTFDPERPGAFLAYLRQTLLNQLRNEARNAGRRPFGDEVNDVHPDGRPSPLERAIGRETLDAYERALEELPEAQREAVMLRVELGLSHGEIADLVGYPTANAARMSVSRGLARLAVRLGELGVDASA